MMPKDPSMWNSAMLGSSTATTPTPNPRGVAGISGSTATPVSAATANNNNNTNNNSSYAFLSTASSSGLLQSAANGLTGSPAGLLQGPGTVSHERSQELCKYFLNGGCLRGAQCQYLHELPDERHLDVNGFGYILNPNVHNAQKTLPLAVSIASPGSVQLNGAAQVSSSPLMLGLNTGAARVPHGAKGKPQTPFIAGVSAGHLSFPVAMPAVKSGQPPKYRPPEPFLEYNLPPTLALPFNTPTKEVAEQLTKTMLQN